MKLPTALILATVWEIGTVPGSSAEYTVTGLYRDGVLFPAPIPAAPLDDDPLCVGWPEWCEARRAARDAAMAWNAEGLAEIRATRSHGDPDYNGDGVINSQDWMDFNADWWPRANGG